MTVSRITSGLSNPRLRATLPTSAYLAGLPFRITSTPSRYIHLTSGAESSLYLFIEYSLPLSIFRSDSHRTTICDPRYVFTSWTPESQQVCKSTRAYYFRRPHNLNNTPLIRRRRSNHTHRHKSRWRTGKWFILGRKDLAYHLSPMVLVQIRYDFGSNS